MSQQSPQELQLASTSGSAQALIQSNANSKTIFLSHSGHDKPFVKKLYDALCKAGHDPFFDTHSLPPGEPFPPHIFQNASGCTLGVVVLSPNFLKSRWPMVELHSMHTSPSKPKILPLFFRLKPDDVKPLSPHFAEWRDAWQQLAEKHPRVNVTEWEAATKNLAILNGVVYMPDNGEDIFIEDAVRRICSIVRPPPRYMLSHVIGCTRLTQEVASLFDEIPSSSDLKAQAIGLYGVGGQGKTTMCQLMVHHYAVEYAGRCTLIELATGDYQEAHALKQCKKALWQLTNINDNRLGRIDNLDQCLQLLKDKVACVDVFIAIDNIWEHSLKFAQRIMDIGFSKGSKLLVTSRSGKVLINLLKDSRSVRPVTSVNREEARQVFIDSLSRNNGTDLHLEESDVDEMTGYLFQHQYHPLAISALGATLGRMEKRDWPATQRKIHHLFMSNDNVVAKAIRINYDSIPKIRREMFLDVALIYIPMLTRISYGRWSTQTMNSHMAETYGCSRVDDNFDHLHSWLIALYKGRIDEWEIIRNLMQLTYDGLLESDDSFGYGRRKFDVHDLYKDLAIQEGAASGKFLVDQEYFKEKDIKCTEVERVILYGYDDVLRRGPLPNVHLLRIPNYLDFRWSSQLVNMPELRILSWHPDDISVCYSIHDSNNRLHGWKDTPHLSWLELEHLTFEDISELTNLLVLRLVHCRLVFCTRLCVSRMVDLQVLTISRVEGIKEIMGLGSLINLKSMSLSFMPHLRKVGIYGRDMTQLQVLEIRGCELLEDVEGVSLLPNLKALECAQDWLCEEVLMFTKSIQVLNLSCRGAQPLNLRGMSALEILDLNYIPVGGGYFPRIGDIYLYGEEVKGIAAKFQMPNLESIDLYNCKEFDWSSFHGLINLKYITIQNSGLLPMMQLGFLESWRFRGA